MISANVCDNKAPIPTTVAGALQTARPDKVLVALSGGVDSSVCVRLLQEQGFDVSAVVIYFSPAHAATLQAAQTAADELKIPLSVCRCEALFERRVIAPFCEAYQNGLTPNPCVICNPHVKFRVLAEEADRLGIRFIATGHYARVEEKDGVWHLARALSTARDQSYMLYRLPQDILSRLCLPVGEFEKPFIRTLAQMYHLSCAGQPDSQEICFIPDGDYAAYIERRGTPPKAGHFISPDGADLGPHKGVLHYTVGQRRGIGLALGQPVFVKSILPNGDIQLAYSGGEFFSGVTLTSVVTASGNPFEENAAYTVKIRSAAQPVACRVRYGANGGCTILFDQPQRAPAPGQSAVLYRGDLLMGGGFIDTVFE